MSETSYRRLDFSDVALYGVTPSSGGAGLVEKVERAIHGGTDAIQLRVRDLKDREMVALGKRLKEICARSGVLLLVNNRPDIALAIDADGVHVGHEDLPLPFVRSLVGHRRIVGASTHALPEALEAQRQGADYVSCGPIWATPTKPEYPPVGLNLIALYRAALRIPFVAIGGIDESNILEVVKAGAKAVAVVRGLFEAEDPSRAATNLKEKMGLNRSSAGV